MRVLISADIEGASGVVSFRETGYPRNSVGDPEATPDYLAARKRLTGDVNAAVEGALAAGATEFVLHDSHGLDYRNVVFEELHPAVEVVRGMPIIFYESKDLERQYDAALLIAMHSRPNKPAVLSHALSWPLLQEIRLNDRPVGESEITIELAGHFGIPTVLITGDDAVCQEAAEWTEGQIQTAVVKHSLSRYAARCLPLAEARKRIRQAAELALERVSRSRPAYASPPYTLRVSLLDRQIASYVAWMPGVQYDGECQVLYRSDDFLSVYKALLAMFWIGASALNP